MSCTPTNKTFVHVTVVLFQYCLGFRVRMHVRLSKHTLVAGPWHVCLPHRGMGPHELDSALNMVGACVVYALRYAIVDPRVRRPDAFNVIDEEGPVGFEPNRLAKH